MFSLKPLNLYPSHHHITVPRCRAPRPWNAAQEDALKALGQGHEVGLRWNRHGEKRGV